MLRQYPKEVKLVYKEFPLRSHRFSAMASLAAIAAGRQGKYWQMHDKIFASYSSLTEKKLKAFAMELGLNMSQFERDRNTLSAKQRVKRDIQDGLAAGVHGTPTIFVNGRLLRQRSLSGFTQMIGRELEKAADR
ncbi:MAG: thioredoxin domain-containing protein [Deltaproteobacteria bacterium]|nr:thioredoxin domain-containing protein [Deltaproteobacteria bacterium]